MSSVATNPTEEVSPLQSSTALLAVFNKAAAAEGGNVLSQTAFVALVKNILAPMGLPKPSYKDLAVAFGVADEDKSGVVDVFEVRGALLFSDV